MNFSNLSSNSQKQEKTVKESEQLAIISQPISLESVEKELTENLNSLRQISQQKNEDLQRKIRQLKEEKNNPYEKISDKKNTILFTFFAINSIFSGLTIYLMFRLIKLIVNPKKNE